MQNLPFTAFKRGDIIKFHDIGIDAYKTVVPDYNMTDMADEIIAEPGDLFLFKWAEIKEIHGNGKGYDPNCFWCDIHALDIRNNESVQLAVGPVEEDCYMYSDDIVSNAVFQFVTSCFKKIA